VEDGVIMKDCNEDSLMIGGTSNQVTEDCCNVQHEISHEKLDD
jgi:hypothetical protein